MRGRAAVRAQASLPGLEFSAVKRQGLLRVEPGRSQSLVCGPHCSSGK